MKSYVEAPYTFFLPSPPFWEDLILKNRIFLGLIHWRGVMLWELANICKKKGYLPWKYFSLIDSKGPDWHLLQRPETWRPKDLCGEGGGEELAEEQREERMSRSFGGCLRVGSHWRPCFHSPLPCMWARDKWTVDFLSGNELNLHAFPDWGHNQGVMGENGEAWLLCLTLREQFPNCSPERPDSKSLHRSPGPEARGCAVRCTEVLQETALILI